MRPSASFSLSIGNAVTLLCGAAPHRRSLTISTATHPLFVGVTDTVSAANGLQLVNSFQPYNVCCQHEGDWVSKALWAIAPAGTTAVYVIEGYETYSEYLERIEEMRQYKEFYQRWAQVQTQIDRGGI